MSDDIRHDRVSMKFNEFGKGYVTVNGHDLRSTFSMTVEQRSDDLEHATIRMEAVVDAKVLEDHAYLGLKPKVIKVVTADEAATADAKAKAKG